MQFPLHYQFKRGGGLSDFAFGTRKNERKMFECKFDGGARAYNKIPLRYN
jgi:hypothetical protein